MIFLLCKLGIAGPADPFYKFMCMLFLSLSKSFILNTFMSKYFLKIIYLRTKKKVLEMKTN